MIVSVYVTKLNILYYVFHVCNMCVCGYHFRNTFYNYSVNYDIGLKQVGFKT